ncbi:hypothetical protein ACE10Z_37280 [Bradyrhizobium sp. Pha-3]|uniref:hypothetical protein n=1 Tax=Bradyrhizobium sp. Pha-3 TaxID=208375 RepID=UPI0035D4D116
MVQNRWGALREICIVALVLAGAATLPDLAQAGEMANDSQQKCLELTRIAADSMRLTPADEEFCERFGRVVESYNTERGIPKDDSPSRPSKMSHTEIVALITRFISQNPKYANEPLAAKTMYAISALASGQMR